MFPHERGRLLQDLGLAVLRQRPVVQLEAVEDALAAFVGKAFLLTFFALRVLVVVVDNLNQTNVQLGFQFYVSIF